MIVKSTLINHKSNINYLTYLLAQNYDTRIQYVYLILHV